MNKLLPAITTLLIVTIVGDAEAQVRRQSADLIVNFVDVGQGDAIWIQTPIEGGERRNILIDGGPDRGSNNRLLTYLNAYGLHPGSTIDYVISTHPHDDHYPGLLDVLAQYQVRRIVDSGFPKGGDFGTFVRAAMAERVDGRRSEFIELRKKPNLGLNWGRQVTAEILHVDSLKATGMGRENTRENNASTVIKMAVGKFSFLLMGDAEGKSRNQPPTITRFVERLLLDKPPKSGLRSTVLKAGHHGSETGSTLAFLEAVKPDVVVVMSGRRSFGRTFIPDEAVIRRYETINPDVIVLRTDDQDEAEGRTTKDDADGDDVCILTNGKTLRVYQAVGADRRRTWRRVGQLQ